MTSDYVWPPLVCLHCGSREGSRTKRSTHELVTCRACGHCWARMPIGRWADGVLVIAAGAPVRLEVANHY